MNTLFNKVFSGLSMKRLNDPAFMQWYQRSKGRKIEITYPKEVKAWSQKLIKELKDLL